MKEADLLKSLNHENIVKIEDSFQYDNSQKFGMLLEFCDGGDLSKFIKEHKLKKKHFDELKIIEIFKQILCGLEYLHSKKIIHRDIKTLNIFLHKDGRVKIGDLGIAKVLLYSSCAHTIIGTPLYLAPEVCQEKPYNEKSDIWSLGCVLYELITFSVPFNAQNYVKLCAKISKGIYDPLPSDIKKMYSAEFLRLIELILQKNPDKRPTIKEIRCYKILNNLQNEKIENLNFCNLNNKIPTEDEQSSNNNKNNNVKRPFSANLIKENGFDKINIVNPDKNKNLVNFDNIIKNKLENAEKHLDIKNKNIIANHNNDNYHNKNYFQQNNLFNKKNLNNEINIDINNQ